MILVPRSQFRPFVAAGTYGDLRLCSARAGTFGILGISLFR